MKSSSLPALPLGRALIIIWLATTLVACTIEGGVPDTSVDRTNVLNPLPTSAAVAEALAARADTWKIGLLDRPADLYPYPQDTANQQVVAPVTELLFPSPILAFNYGYTSTGVLERIPTLENGDAEIRKVQVYLDAVGNITTTATDLITQVDQLAVTFHWNPKLHWSDGQPVTADDSVFAYELAKAAAPSVEVRDRLAQIAQYQKVDEHTTRALLQPDFTGPTYFLNYWTPLPRHILKDQAPDKIRSSDFARAPVGYGPYAIAERSATEIRMVRNPHYFGSAPAVSQLVISFMDSAEMLRANILNGNLDVAVTNRLSPDQVPFLDQDVRSNLAQVTYKPSAIWEHIDFNLDLAVLQDIRLRRAIALGTNRQAMADALFAGKVPVLDSWVMPEQPEVAPADQLTRYLYNPDEARKLLEEAGYTDRDGNGIRSSANGMTLTLQLMTTEGSPIRQEIARRFKADMQELGIGVEILSMQSGQLYDPGGPLFQHQFDLALFGWIAASDPGGLPLWSCAAIPNESNGWSGDNFAGWCFRDADRAIREAVTTLDLGKRKEAYLRQQQLWTQELPSLPLFQRLDVTIVAPNVQGTQPDSLAPITWNVAAWRRR